MPTAGAVIDELKIDLDQTIELLRGATRPGLLHEPLGSAAMEIDDAIRQLDANTNPEVVETLAAIEHYLRQLTSVAALMAGEPWAIKSAADGLWSDREQSIGIIMQNGTPFEDAVNAAEQMDKP